MNKTEIDRLAAQLRELRDISDLNGPAGAALRRDIERLAREDLYMANRLFDSYVPEALREQPGMKPLTLKVAGVVERHFEHRSSQDRPPVQLYGERDAIVTRPESGKVYEGEIVGRTPDFAVQKVGDDFILHRNISLAMDPAGLGDNVRIHYPFGGPNSVGLVHERSPEHQLQQQFLKAPLEKDLGMGKELTMRTHQAQQEMER